jgi:hypothetical protein
MKRFGLAGFAAAALLLTLPASGRAQGDIAWGVKGGLNLSGLRGGNGLYDSKRGVVAGAYGVFDFAPEFGIEVDALFSMKGAKYPVFGVSGGGNPVKFGESFFVLDYLEVPILARLNAPAYGRLSPHIYFGPTIAIKVGARAIDNGQPARDLNDVRSLDSGLAAGASVDVALGEYKLVLDGRFGLGLTNAFDSSQPDLKNDSFSLMAGVSF